MTADEEMIVTETGETVADAVEARRLAIATLRGLLKMLRKIRVSALFARRDCPTMKMMLDNSKQM